MALVTLNQQWSYHIDFLGITYKPWRLFLLICGIPSLICTLVLIFLIPESPKYSFSQGDEDATMKIFQRIYKMNTGKSIENYEVKGLIKDGEFGESYRSKSENFFKFMWNQTVPLFKGSHRRNILTACFMQFSICLTNNGFWTFFPEIMNKVSLWIESSRGPATVCEIFQSDVHLSTNQSEPHLICVEKLEFNTFVHIYELLALYTILYGVMSLIINYTGKLVLIVSVTATCGLSALVLMFLNIPSVVSYLYLVLLFTGLSISLVNASTVELFPTKLRFDIIILIKYLD